MPGHRLLTATQIHKKKLRHFGCFHLRGDERSWAPRQAKRYFQSGFAALVLLAVTHSRLHLNGALAQSEQGRCCDGKGVTRQC
jgi:hypothetical protein